ILPEKKIWRIKFASTVAALYERRQSSNYEIAGGHFLRLRAVALALRVLEAARCRACASRTAASDRPVLARLPRKKSSMEPLRFIHAADLHLDSPFRGIADASAGLRDQLQSATLAAL